MNVRFSILRLLINFGGIFMRTWQKAILLALVIIAIPLFYFENRYFSQKAQSTSLKQQQQSTLHTYHTDAGNQYASFKTYLQQKPSGNKIYYFIPKNTQNQPIGLLDQSKKLGNQLYQQMNQQKPTIKRLTVYVTYQSTNIQDDTYAFKLSAVAYGETTQGFKTVYQKLNHLDGAEQIYNLANQTKPVTLQALAKNTTTMTSLKQIAINQLIKERHPDWATVQKLQRLTFNNRFNYTTDGLTLYFEANPLKMTKIDLPLEIVGPYLNPDYVSSNHQTTTVKGRKKAIALTFNTTLKPKVTNAILKTLTANHVPATFLTTGAGAKAHPNVLQALVAAHQGVGVQTYASDDNPATMTTTDWQANVTKTNEAFYQATNQLPSYQRLPLDTANAGLAQVTQRPFIEWSVDSQDWSTTIDAATITSNVLAGVTGGDVVLLHTTDVTSEALPELIKQLTAKGYHFTTVDTLFEQQLTPQQQIFKVGDRRTLK